MKTVLILIFLSVGASAHAQAQNFSNSVAQHFGDIANRVRECSVLPYSVDANGAKALHALYSHCPEVKVLPEGVAQVRVAGHRYEVTLLASIDSDGDFYDVQIRDVVSNELYTLANTLVYGDVLLGVLGGNTNGLVESYISDPELLKNIDSLLVH